MRLPLHDAGTAYGRLARLTGGLAGVGLVLAAVAPFQGVPTRPGRSGSSPAELGLSVLGAGEFDIAPTGTVLQATPFPAPGEHGGPSVAIRIRNITNGPLQIGMRMTTLAPSLDTAVKVRGSVAGAVIVDGPLGRTATWSRPVGLLPSGATTTLRLRFKLIPGRSPDAYLGRLDVRQIELRGVKPSGEAATHTETRIVPDRTPAPPKTTVPPGGPRATPAATPAPAATPEPAGPAMSSGSLPEGENPKGLE